MIGTVWLGHRRLRGAVPVLYGIAVLLGVWSSPRSAPPSTAQRAWLNLGGGFSLQPAEFIKITVILGMAMLLAAKVDAGDREHPDHRTVLQALGMAALPIVVILLMPDLGSVMVHGDHRARRTARLRAPPTAGSSACALAGAGGAVLVWALGLLDEYQINRFAAFANPALDPAGVGYNTNQARIAIGSGGLTGKGLFKGSQTTGQFVPEQQTDFVFTVAGEELGFLAAR